MNDVIDFAKYVEYDSATGLLRWLPRSREHFKSDHRHNVWNARNAHRMAGCVMKGVNRRSCGMIVGILGKYRMVHRVIWEMFYGPIPSGMVIDHIDGDTSNNRLENLRLATPLQNAYNSRVNASSKTGLKGVHLNKRTGKYTSHIRFRGTGKHLGTFPTPESAYAAYCDAAHKYHGEFARVA